MRPSFKKRSLPAASCIAAAGFLFAPVHGSAQTATPVMAFDTTSIRRNVDNIGRCSPDQLQPTPGGFRMTNCPLVMAIGTAYIPTTGEALGFVMGDRMVNLPDWITTQRYDIVARISDADADAWKDPARRKEMLRAMLQTLLAERCKLALHREMKDKPVFDIVVGKNGPKLKTAETTDLDTLRAKYPNAVAVPGGGGIVGGGKNGSDLHDATIGTLALALSYSAGRPVVDKTGLTGRYDMELPRMQSLATSDPAADGVPTLFTVLEGFGLKLESRKDSVEMLVLDHVERPTEN